MTERIYYTDPYCRRFQAQVVRVDRFEGKAALVLDRTAFYPTSGGQPFDTGTIGGVRVADVVEQEDGTILHVLGGEPPAMAEVEGSIDWDRRFDHMQQHTGQHVLSAAFGRLHEARTVGFHLGATVSTIDLDRSLPPEAIAAAETESNRVVWENRPVSIRFVDDRESAGVTFRKEPGHVGRLRIIEVEGFDVCACGGTHVARTGEIGVIAVLSSERFRGGIRLEFACGSRALSAFRTFRDAVSGSLGHLSVLPSELPAAIERMQSESKDLRKAMRRVQGRLATFEAESVAKEAEMVGGRRHVVRALEGWDADALKAMASAITAKDGFEVALFSRAAPLVGVVACSRDSQIDANAVMRSLTARFGGKGGGRRDLAQGGGFVGNVDEVLGAARAALKEVT
ncbi:MAG: DHHA1 domain-containing protein [Vicinamibacterales bacterium]